MTTGILALGATAFSLQTPRIYAEAAPTSIDRVHASLPLGKARDPDTDVELPTRLHCPVDGTDMALLGLGVRRSVR